VDGTNKQSGGSDAAEAWKEVVTQFRSFCFSRRQGKVADSGAIIQERLPRQISVWSKSSRENLPKKRAQLQQMFRDEQRRVEDACSFQELASSHFQESLLPFLRNTINQEVKHALDEQLPGRPGDKPRPQASMGEEIQRAMAEELEIQSTRLAAQNAALEAMQKTVADIAEKALTAPSAAPSEGAPFQPSTPSPALQARIPFDDIPAIIDQLISEERREKGRRPFATMPLRRV
jgi:hypothetical protein